jgi:hypothetical protein
MEANAIGRDKVDVARGVKNVIGVEVPFVMSGSRDLGTTIRCVVEC